MLSIASSRFGRVPLEPPLQASIANEGEWMSVLELAAVDLSRAE
jgi:hypothetical protein